MGVRYRKSINLGGGFRIGQRYRSQNCLYSGNWYILCRGNRQEKAALSCSCKEDTDCEQDFNYRHLRFIKHTLGQPVWSIWTM